MNLKIYRCRKGIRQNSQKAIIAETCIPEKSIKMLKSIFQETNVNSGLEIIYLRKFTRLKDCYKDVVYCEIDKIMNEGKK